MAIAAVCAAVCFVPQLATQACVQHACRILGPGMVVHHAVEIRCVVDSRVIAGAM